MAYNEKKLSSGGAGDSFIVASKLYEREGQPIDWLHIESVNLEPMFSDMMKYLKLPFCGITYEFQHNEDYINKYKQGRWKDYSSISSGVDDWCPLKGKCEWKLENPFVITTHIQKYEENKIYDVCIQVASGMGNSRRYKFSPLALAQLLRNKGYKVALVGTMKLYEDQEDKDNFVNKLSISETLELISQSKTLVSSAGLLTYFAVACKVPTIYFEESPEHTKRYIHSFCQKYAYPIKFGSIQEVKKELERFGIKI